MMILGGWVGEAVGGNEGADMVGLVAVRRLRSNAAAWTRA